MPTSGNVLATPLIDPELISGVSFSMAKAPWIISSSLRMKFQTITGVRSAAGHWNSDRETVLTGLRNIAMARVRSRIRESSKTEIRN